MPEVTAEQLDRIKNHKTVVISSGLESSLGEKIFFECYLIPSGYDRTFLLLTALAGKIEVAFLDAQDIADRGNVVIEAPYFNKGIVRFDGNFSHNDIRLENSPNGIYVEGTERNRKIATEMMLTVRSIFEGLDRKRIFISQPSPAAIGFYKEIGMEPFLTDFIWDLSKDNKNK